MSSFYHEMGADKLALASSSTMIRFVLYRGGYCSGKSGRVKGKHEKAEGRLCPSALKIS
jgi:hypothetical protein